MARISQFAGMVNQRTITLGVISTFSLLTVFFYLVSVINVSKPEPAVKSVEAFFAEFPMHFQSNLGNFTHDVKFFSKGYQYDLLFMNNEVLLKLYSSEKPDPASVPRKQTTRLTQMSLEFIDANNLPIIKGLNPVVARAAADTGKAQHSIASFTEVKYANVYPGIDVYFHGKQKQLFYEFVLAENASSDSVKMRVSGIDGAGIVSIDSHGDITVSCHGKKMLIKKPQVFRLVKQHKQPVNGYFFVTSNNEIRFRPVEQRELI